MIKVEDLTKKFDELCAVNHVSLSIPEGVMYGLLGTNGAGKSTLLRIMAGILTADSGHIYIDEENVFENLNCKRNIFYLPDDPYYFPNANIKEMVSFYQRQYPELAAEDVSYMAEQLNLDTTCPIRTFSKGMKRQAFLILALCANTKYLLCDEVFDGLDPLVTQTMKSLFKKEMESRKFTVIVASHNLQDLEDICRHIAILHKGGVITSGDMRGRTENIFKIQCVFGAYEKDLTDASESGRYDDPEEIYNMLQGTGLSEKMDIISLKKDGYFVTLIVKGEKERIMEILRRQQPVFMAEVPMTLEERFISVRDKLQLR